MSLHEVVGHRTLRKALARAAGEDSLAASLLLHGPTGVGKQRLAFWIAQLVLCERPDAAGPCGSCRSCRLALRLEHPDLHWHMPLPRPRRASTPERLAEALEDARAAHLAAMRESPLQPSWSDEPRAHYLAAARTLRRRAHSRPAMGSRQVFIIGDAETLVPQESSPEAANSLLKLLEEPPDGTRFILTTSEPGRLLATIRSRCLPLHLAPLPDDVVATFLLAHTDASEEEARHAASLGQGSVGRALGFLESDGEAGPLQQLRRQALDLVRAGTGSAGSGFTTAMEYRPAGARGMLELFAFVEEWLRDVVAVAAGAPEQALHRDFLAELERLARDLDPTGAAGALQEVEEAREQARGNVNPQLIVTGLVSRLRRRLQPRTAAVAEEGRP
jgi:DNA polymerase-3 subunit delta'